MSRKIAAVAALLLVSFSHVSAAGPNADTLAAWSRETLAAEVRLRRPQLNATIEREPQGGAVHVSSGTIHIWRGSTRIRHVTVEQLLQTLRDPGTPPPQEDVLESRVLARSDDTLRVYLKLSRTVIVTVVYDTEHEIRFTRESADLATGQSVSTKISEEGGRDRGFLWRLNSYWRYTQAGPDVVVDLESLSLSRDVPPLVRPIAAPVINHIARESVTRTLDALRRYIESHCPAGF